ncbi:CD109 antigen-like isoform X2 [Hyposmocoma kahamanoa]|nr:CD109 antigen-like isoform X2 [Hyposmocoma kahamanoa]XP_026329691.1 CD109 antigen-like isoform X2 [Hyposmocoma kahamanoa]XP_026329699.1 CD109 antigen-like isoform X2 [Hyposmocoma kahamanoa]
MTLIMILQCLFVVLITPSVIQCVSVLGPRILRPFGSYRIAVSGGSRPQTLYIAVEGRRATGEQFSQGREVQVQTANSRLIDLDIGDPGPGQYVLMARSTSGPQFSSSAPLIYQPRSFCIFVQTDKRVYQPGDVIKFRVIALDKYLLPLTGAVDVSVLDSGGSPVRQWVASNLDRGLLTRELLLADEPALGQWTIQAEVRGQMYSRQIMVADYVMPKFEMEMKMPKEILFSDRRFTVNVTARHFNGLPVHGELTLSAYAVFFSGLLQPVFSSPARKVVDFNGGVEVTYDLKTDLDLAEDAARPLVVEAVLEEKNTLIRQNVSSRILLLRTPYRLKVTAPEHFKPELSYNVQIEVVDPSGKIMDNVNDDVTVERLWDDGAPANVTNVPLKNGFAAYTIVPSKAHTNSTLNLVVKYKEVSERVVNIQRNEMYGGQFLSLEVLTRETSVGDVMRARITGTEPMDLVHYAVIGRGDILVAKTLELTPARQSVDISVPITVGMAPGCVILAWYPRLDPIYNTVLAASVFVPQKNLLQHKISVLPASATAAGYRPNGSIELRVSGEPGSQAALLGVDTNAITAKLSDADGLGSGLEMQKIEREVESFIGLKHSIFKNEDHLPGFGFDLGGYTTGDVFKNAGVVILTEGVTRTLNGGDSFKEQPETGTRPPLAGPYAFSRLPPPLSPRYYLTVNPQPTWTFTNVTLGSEGKGTGQSWSPMNPGEWTVGAFAIHSTLGLGLAVPQRFTTNVPLAITAELPASLQRGETLAAVIILKSSLTVDTSVEVTFHNSDQYFEFEPLENNVESSKKIELFRRVRVTVPARSYVSTAFLVTVVRNGEAPVIVEATGNGVSASLFRIIDVKDGFEEDLWAWGLLDARRSVARSNITLEPTAGTRVGPVSLLGAGTLLAGALHTRNPGGVAADPPHALRPLALATVLLDYLQLTDPSETTITMEARAQIAAGFQRLMAYRRGDGSFAAETGDDAVGDPWMTAVALRWLSRSARYVEVSPVATAAAARWLTGMQQADGSWPVTPKPRNDPRAQALLPLTAQALLALLHTKGGDILYQNAISKAVDFLARGVNDNLDAYSLAVMSTAFGDTRHPFATKTLQMMDKFANTSATTLFWSRKLSGNEWRNPWLKGNNFETATAAWGLKAMLASKLVDEALPVARYLLQSYRPQDQDPEVLDALAQYSDAVKTSTKLRISVNVTGFEEPRQINIDDDNALFIQTQLVRNARSALAVTEGRGIAIVGLSAKGSTNVTAAWPRYTLDPRVDQVSTKYRLQLSICAGFVPQGNETESGLTLLSVQLPSGYLADINTLTELTAARHVVSARLQNGGARVVAWMYMRLSEQCTTLIAPRALPTARQRPGWATLEDLYDSSHRARLFFQPIPSTACDACREWESCSKACGSSARQQSGGGRESTASSQAAAMEVARILFIGMLFLTLQ